MGEPDLAIAEPGDRHDAAIDRPPALATYRHLALNASRRPDLDLIHIKGVTLQQPPSHFRGGHRLGFRTAIGDRLFGQGLDPGFDPGELVGLIQRRVSRDIKKLFSCKGQKKGIQISYDTARSLNLGLNLSTLRDDRPDRAANLSSRKMGWLDGRFLDRGHFIVSLFANRSFGRLRHT
jgi:hypothetical protein